MPTKIYISGSITGHNDYMEKFSEAESELKKVFGNAAIINPAKTAALAEVKGIGAKRLVQINDTIEKLFREDAVANSD